ncbi:MAG: A/G-specific adenine glycosylase, partial [Acinetobacter sp.]|nr:A/G-specific adenine glycosylase [Acinetobacter sp.]
DEKMFHVEHDQKEQLSIELNGIWLTPESAIAKGIPTAMKKLITAKQKT